MPLSRTERVESYDFHGRGILSIPFTAFAWSDGTVATARVNTVAGGVSSASANATGIPSAPSSSEHGAAHLTSYTPQSFSDTSAGSRSSNSFPPAPNTSARPSTAFVVETFRPPSTTFSTFVPATGSATWSAPTYLGFSGLASTSAPGPDLRTVPAHVTGEASVRERPAAEISCALPSSHTPRVGSSSTTSSASGSSDCQFSTFSASKVNAGNGLPRLACSHTANAMYCVGLACAGVRYRTIHFPEKESVLSAERRHEQQPQSLEELGARMPMICVAAEMMGRVCLIVVRWPSVHVSACEDVPFTVIGTLNVMVPPGHIRNICPAFMVRLENA